MMQARETPDRIPRLLGTLLLAFTLGVAAMVGYVPRAHAQTQLPAAEPEPASLSSSPVVPAQSDREWVSVTFNPLNLIINRYALNVELQPARHHSIVLTPHYDYLSGNHDSDHCCFTDTFKGGGVEIGYRFYTGQAFNGFYFGPSLLVSTYRLTRSGGSPEINFDTNLMNYGWAVDLGYVLRAGHFVLGLGLGMGYVENSKHVDLGGDDIDVWIQLHAHKGLLPRLGVGVGFAI
jgi:hypothetical protein